MQFQIGSKCGQGYSQEICVSLDGPAVLTGGLEGLCLDGNW